VFKPWNEAQDIWNSAGKLEDNIQCLVSIGTGRPSLRPLGNDFIEVGQSLVAISTETESTAESFIRDKRQLYMEGWYFRFNVESGLEDIGFEDLYQKNAIVSATSDYLESHHVFTRMQSFSMISKSFATLGDTEAYYNQEGLADYKAKEWTQTITLLEQAVEGRDHCRLEDDQIAWARQHYAEALYHTRQHEMARVGFQKLVVWAENRFGKQHVETMKNVCRGAMHCMPAISPAPPANNSDSQPWGSNGPLMVRILLIRCDANIWPRQLYSNRCKDAICWKGVIWVRSASAMPQLGLQLTTHCLISPSVVFLR
jgi:hypothetical protein